MATPPTTPFAHWTPNGWWLFAEAARRALVAQRDGGPFERAGSVGFTVDIEPGPDALALVMRLDAAWASLALRPVDGGYRLRDTWVLELSRGNDRWVLAPGDAPLVIGDARSGPVRARLAAWQRVLTPTLDGEVVELPVDEASFHRHTMQSSRGAALPDEAVPRCMIPTAPETDPWWEIDLGTSMHVVGVRVALRDPPPDATVTLAAYAYRTRDGDPTPGCFAHTAPAEGAVGALVDTIARYVRVTLRAPSPSVLCLDDVEVSAVDLFAATLQETVRRAFALHPNAPLFMARDGDEGPYVATHTYAEVWARAMGLGRSLARHIERDDAPQRDGRRFVALMTRNRPEWVMTELAALVRGWVVVPLNPDDRDEALAAIVARCTPACVVCEARDASRLATIAPGVVAVLCDAPPDASTHLRFDDLARDDAPRDVPPPAPRSPDDLYSVLFTSGSTGAPKGAMRSYATVHRMLTTYGIDQGTRHLSFQPLSHLSERMYLPALLLQGATVAFSRGGAHLMRELRDFEPTNVSTVPRLFEVLMAQYRRRLAALRADPQGRADATLESIARAEARGAFGGRLRSVGVGSAPVSDELRAFLRRTFVDLWFAEGYGSTELGTIAVDGRIQPHVEVKLVPSGPRAPDDPERGEIWVRTTHRIDGYLGDEAATRASLDDEGYFATGDLGERGADGSVRVVGRLRNTVKLAQGEFVSVERVETALSTAPFVDRVYVHASPGDDAVSAVVVPHDDAPDDLAAPLRAHGRRAGLAAWELPRAVLVERAPFTVANGLLTATGKLARAALSARYATRLAALATTSPEPSTPSLDASPDDPLARTVARALSTALRRSLGPRDAIGPSLDVDSLAAAEAMTALGEALGRRVPLSWWFECATPTALAARLERFDDAASEGSALAREDLRAALPDVADLAPPALPWRAVLLTGATGLVGAHLLEAIAARGDVDVLCMVRAPSDEAAARRLDEALARYEVPLRAGGRVRAFAGDLAAPGLGLTDPWAARLRDEVDAIVHSGARVHWLDSYTSLRAPNVRGTLALLELAMSGRARPFHFVSTISTAPVGGDEDARLTLDEALRAGPYALSKWVAEALVRRAGELGLPVAVYRPGMVGGHSRRGVGNPDDYLHRYLDGCAALGRYLDLDARLDLTPVDFVAEAIAALMRAHPLGGGTWNLVGVEPLTYAAHGRAMARAGLAVTPADYDAFRAALTAAPGSRLTALEGFFPAGRAAVGMGPWNSARTVAALEALGLARPPVDDALIARYVARARDRSVHEPTAPSSP